MSKKKQLTEQQKIHRFLAGFAAATLVTLLGTFYFCYLAVNAPAPKPQYTYNTVVYIKTDFYGKLKCTIKDFMPIGGEIRYSGECYQSKINLEGHGSFDEIPVEFDHFNESEIYLVETKRK